MPSTLLQLSLHRRTIAAVLPLMLLCSWLLASVTPDQRQVLLPILTAVAITAVLFIVVWNRTGVVPIFDVGCIAVLATLLYTIVPPLQFLLAGMQHTVVSSFQLFVLAPTPAQMGAFTWRYTVYLGAIAAAYAVFRHTRTVPTRPVTDPGTIRVLVSLYVALLGLIYIVKITYGVQANVSYQSDIITQNYAALQAMPLILRQVYSIALSLTFIIKIGLLLTIFLNWDKRRYRLVLYGWLALILVGYAVRMGARSELVLTLFAAMILYHRFVRRIGFVRLATAGAVILVGFFFLGLVRGWDSTAAGVENVRTVMQYSDVLFSVGNEFQVIFAGAYDLAWMKAHGIVQHVPMQFLFYDVIMLVPQQLLPFTKIDVQAWYLGLSMNPGFFMFSPVAQSVLGFGWTELVARGVLLGLVFAWLNRWYLRHSADFWKTLFFCTMVVMAYYSARNAPLYFFAHMLIYKFIPLYLVVRLLTSRTRTAPGLTFAPSAGLATR